MLGAWPTVTRSDGNDCEINQLESATSGAVSASSYPPTAVVILDV